MPCSCSIEVEAEQIHKLWRSLELRICNVLKNYLTTSTICRSENTAFVVFLGNSKVRIPLLNIVIVIVNRFFSSSSGIYVARVRPGGPADNSVSLLRPMDRILQINETRTHDFDCCLAVPLIAAAGDKIELLITRNDNDENNEDASTLRSGRTSSQGSNSTMPWIDEDTLKALNNTS